MVTNHSYHQIDKYIGTYNVSNDDRHEYTQANNYKKVIRQLFFQKVITFIVNV